MTDPHRHIMNDTLPRLIASGGDFEFGRSGYVERSVFCQVTRHPHRGEHVYIKDTIQIAIACAVRDWSDTHPGVVTAADLRAAAMVIEQGP